MNNQWDTFFTHPMRPFFVSAAALAMTAAMSFLIVPNHAIVLHRLIFLQLMLPCAYGGFLLAAMLEWTNFSGSLKKIGFVLGGILLAAFLALWIVPNVTAYLITAYWLILLLFCIWLIWLDRNMNNFALLLLLGLFTIFQAAFAYSHNLDLLKIQVHLNMAAVMFVSFRVSILLGNEALKECCLKDPVFIPNVVYKNMAMTLLLLYVAANVWLPQNVLGFLALAIGLILLAKLRELHHWELLRKNYVRTYYALQAFGAVGYLWLGYAQLTGEMQGTPLHLITLAAMFGGVFMVWLTAGLWHSGFAKLDYPKACQAAVGLLFAVALLRTIAMPYAPDWLLMRVPSLLLLMVFGLYLWTFIPLFSKNKFTVEPE